MTSRKAQFNSRTGSNLMALGSAAVLAVYAAGYLRTKPAADQLAAQSSMRSVRRPFPPTAGAQGAPDRPATAPSLDAAVRTVAGDSAAAAEIAAARAAEASALPAATATIAALPGTGSPTAPTDPASTTPTAPAVVRDSVAVAAPTASAPAVATPAPVVIPTAPAPVAAPSVPAAPAPTPVPAADPAPPAAKPAAANPPAAKPAAKAGYRDGLHYGRGTSRHGDIESLIEISNGRIISVVISQCLTQYTCRWISALPGQVIARQSPDVDYVTGATESANAFYFSIVQALMQAK